jgi:hypothetical protein
LDWLASEFVQRGFSMKQVHRLMVTSDAYRRASEAGGEYSESQKIDPGGTTLWHFRLQRLGAEPIWDSLHAAAGDLDLKVGGPSFDAGAGDVGNRRRRSESAGNTSLKRRGAYMVRGYSPSRDVTPNFLQAFDVDDGRTPCPMRTQTVMAPQALFLMNSPDVDKACAEFAARLQKEVNLESRPRVVFKTTGGLPSAVDLAYRMTLSRPPSTTERINALTYLENDATRLKQLGWLLFNLDEFIYVK